MESREGGQGAVWTVSSPMNECMEVFLKKISLPAHILDQEFGNTLGEEKQQKPLHHLEQCLGLDTVENQ